MRVFLSYSRANQDLATRINGALVAAGFDTFMDTKDLPLGEEYNARIKLAVDDADLFIFLASKNSVRPGSYAMTELSFAEQKWPNPSGYVLPVLLKDFDPAQLPAYLRPINALKIKGNPEAEIVGWVQKRSESGSGGVPLLTPRDRLQRWARLAQPPLRKGRRIFAWKGLIGLLFGAFFTLFGFIPAFILMETGTGWDMLDIAFAIPILAGVGLILRSLWAIVQGLRGGGSPVPVVVLDRKSTKNEILIELETVQGKRLKLYPVTKETREIYAGDLGWAYIRGSLLLEFISASSGESAPRPGSGHG